MAKAATRRPRMEQQTCGFNPATRQVVSIQRWSGFSAGRHALIVTVNDTVTFCRSGGSGQVNRWFAIRGLAQGFTYVDETRARAELAKAGHNPRECSCKAVLPLGGQWCSACGAVQPARKESPAA